MRLNFTKQLGHDEDGLQSLAATYRKTAEELRKLAEMDVSQPTHNMLVNSAATYEKMAETADAIMRSYQAMTLSIH